MAFQAEEQAMTGQQRPGIIPAGTVPAGDIPIGTAVAAADFRCRRGTEPGRERDVRGRPTTRQIEW